MKSMGINIDKEFLENNRNEQMRNVISELTESIDSKVDNTVLIDKVQEYETFVKESELKPNKTIEDKAEESKKEIAIKKIMAETLINRLQNEKKLSEEKMQEEMKNIIEGNNINVFSEEQIDDIQNIAKQQIANMYNDEIISRKNEIENSVNYVAESATTEEKKKVQELKNKTIEELTIGDLKALKKNRVKSYIEQDRIIENIKLYNTTNANLGKQGVSESDLAQYFFDKGNEKYNEKTHKKILKAYNKANKKKTKIDRRREQAVKTANQTEGEQKKTDTK